MIIYSFVRTIPKYSAIKYFESIGDPRHETIAHIISHIDMA